jgi:hypothetical protein
MQLVRQDHWRILAVAFLLAFCAFGCGKGHKPVRGIVIFEDGQPLTKGIVVFESMQSNRPITARGEIQPDGSYQLGTDRPEDGVPSGKYRVLITPIVENPDAPEPLAFDKRYTGFQSSGLEFEVKSGTNEYPIKLARAGKPRR